MPVRFAARANRPGRSNDHNGCNSCNGCRRRSLGFARVRLPEPKPLQRGSFGELKRTGANAREHLPCRRSWVRVPSSALNSLQIGGCRRQVGKRWLQRGCTRSRSGARVGPAIWRFMRSPSGLTVPVPRQYPANRRFRPVLLCCQPPARRGLLSGTVHRFLQKVIRTALSMTLEPPGAAGLEPCDLRRGRCAQTVSAGCGSPSA
jgi:hypothetical protein